MSDEEVSPSKSNSRVVGGWTRDVHVVDMQTMTELESRVRKEVENQLVHKIKEAEKALQHERELRYKAEDEASQASSAKKSFGDLNIAMTEMNELSTQAAAQVLSAKEKARSAKEEANAAKQRAIKAEASRDEALRRANELEHAKERATKAAAAAKEAEERAVKQAAVHAEAMAERHALHVQRMREAMERDTSSAEKALAKGMESVSKRVNNLTTSLSAAFSEAVARLEAEHADAVSDLESDREALLLRKAIGQSAYAVMQAEKLAKSKGSHYQIQEGDLDDENQNTSNSSLLNEDSYEAPVIEERREATRPNEPSSPPSSMPQPIQKHTRVVSPVLPAQAQAPSSPPLQQSSAAATPKNLSKVKAMLAKSEKHAQDVLEGRSHSPNRGLPDEASPTKVNVNAPLPPIVIDSIKNAFNAHVAPNT